MDTSELEEAYRSVLDLAARGAGDGPPGPGSGEAWGPDDVLAHLILNDRLLARAVRSVLDGAAQPYDNLDAIEPAALRALTRDLGDTAGLIGGREGFRREV